MRRTLAISLTILGILSRLLPHPPNFTAVGAGSLFSGGRVNGWLAYALPLLVMAITDPIINTQYGLPLYSIGAPVIYASLLVNVWLGRRLQGSDNMARIAAFTFLGSLQFFLVSNALVWLNSHAYAKSLAGLATCYTMALPFFGRTLAGDLCFSLLLFGGYRWIAKSLRTEAEPCTVAARA